MTDAAFEELYQIMLNNRKEFINKKPNVAKIFQKWKLRYDAAYFAIDFPVNCPALCKKGYPILHSGKILFCK